MSDWKDWKRFWWSPSDWKNYAWCQEEPWPHDKDASKCTGSCRPVSCRDWGQGWSELVNQSNSTWQGNPASCRDGGESGGARGSQDKPWAWGGEEGNQAQPKQEPLDGAPGAARRWLASAAYELGIEVTSSGAAALERAKQHRDRYVNGVSCCGADPHNDASDSDGYDAAFFKSLNHTQSTCMPQITTQC